MDKLEIAKLKALSLAINDNFPNFLLEFVEKIRQLIEHTERETNDAFNSLVSLAIAA